MYLTIIILPFLGSIAVGLFGRKLGIVGSQIITLSCILITSALAIISFFEIGFTDSTVTVHLFQYLGGDLLNIGWTFKFDSLTVSMLLPVTFISLLVQIYSVSYLKGDPHCQRFFCYLTLFTAFMGILVSANNYLVLFVGLLGLFIFFLI